jgi:hypothetical protein
MCYGNRHRMRVNRIAGKSVDRLEPFNHVDQ